MESLDTVLGVRMDESKAAVLAELYKRVGSPGYATIARLSGGNVSKSSVENLLKGPGNPRFDTVSGFVQGCLAFAKSKRWVCGLAPGEREGAYWLATVSRCARYLERGSGE